MHRTGIEPVSADIFEYEINHAPGNPLFYHLTNDAQKWYKKWVKKAFDLAFYYPRVFLDEENEGGALRSYFLEEGKGEGRGWWDLGFILKLA